VPLFSSLSTLRPSLSFSLSLFVSLFRDSETEMATALASSTASSSRCAIGSSRSRQQQRAGRRVPKAPRAGPSLNSVCSFFVVSRPRCFMFPITVLGSTMQCRISRSRHREREEWAFVCMPWNSRFLGESEEDRALQSKGAILFRALPLNPDLLLSLFSPPQNAIKLQRTPRPRSSSSSAPPPPAAPAPRSPASTAAPSAAPSPRRAATSATRPTTPSRWR